MKPQSKPITELLQSWKDGDESAIERLVPLVYAELHRLAQRHMSDEKPGHTLQTTALVNEAYVRLVGSHVNWENRTHFFAVCAQVMRRILVDWARSRGALKRGGDQRALEFDEDALAAIREPATDLLAIDEALQSLAAIDARKSRVVEMRFFGGLSVRETAEILKVSDETVQRDWKFAKSWLRRELSRNC